MASAEFRSQYGHLGNRDFVDAMHANTLGRPADQAGLDHRTNWLDGEFNARTVVVLALSESAEHVALTEAKVQSENPREFGILFT